MLVQHKANKTHYAMKILDKQKVSSSPPHLPLAVNIRERAEWWPMFGRRSIITCFVCLSGGEAETGGTHAEREKDPASHQLPLLSQFRVSLQGEAIASGIAKKTTWRRGGNEMCNTCRITVTYTWSLSLWRLARCSGIYERLASLGIRRAADIKKSTAALSS